MAICKKHEENHPSDLSGSYVMRQLPPFASNVKKRPIKAPKVYLCDFGLLQIDTMADLQSNPRYRASWEGFALEQLCSVLRLDPDETFFWGTHGGAEIDLVIERGGKRYGFEFKVTEKPSVTHSMTIAQSDLGLEKVFLVCPGELSFPLREGMEAQGYARIPEFGFP